MSRITMALAVLVACLIAACGSTSTTTKTVTKSVAAAPLSSSTSTTPEVQTVTTVTRPPCPRLTFGADGNAGPLTCTIDSPAALHYFARWVDPLLKLGPDATPEQVANQLQRVAKQSSGPITCSVYALAQRAEDWHFAVNPAGGVTDAC
jgi:hypothetical protein